MENYGPTPPISERVSGDLRGLSALMEIFADVSQLMILARLLADAATQKELREELQLGSGPISRKMAELERAGLVSRDRSHGPYRLQFREDVLRVLHATSDLHLRQVESRAQAAERALRRAGEARAGFELEGEESSTG